MATQAEMVLDLIQEAVALAPTAPHPPASQRNMVAVLAPMIRQMADAIAHASIDSKMRSELQALVGTFYTDVGKLSAKYVNTSAWNTGKNAAHLLSLKS